jgi:ferredoxin-nitrite reductase
MDSADSNASVTFTQEQKEYLQGFTAGIAAAGTLPNSLLRMQSTSVEPAAADDGSRNASQAWFGWPVDEITREEQLKRDENPLDIWDKLLAHSQNNHSPEGGDIYRFKSHGLFYVAPAQDSLMLRVRIPGNVMDSMQMRALAGIASELGGGYAHVTTRGNIQIREISPRNITEVLMRLSECGLSSRGAGADNVRNITSSPLSGIDPTELINTWPFARALQFYLSNNRDLYGLPRKFNVSFDGGGAVSVATETNDIGFIATRFGRVSDVSDSVYFRVLLGGITGHSRFAFDCGLLVAPEECVAVAAAMLRVFAEHGDRTDRKKARLCYLLDRLGTENFLQLVGAKLGFRLRFESAEHCSPRAPVSKRGYIGIHPQTQPELSLIGMAMPVGHMSSEQMLALAQLAQTYGTGELRLTVWQNIILPHVQNARVVEATRAIQAVGYDVTASAIGGGVVACTGNTGCRFSATDTKQHALHLARYLNERVTFKAPLNIHLTGCPNSCAQHRIGDIGLLGTSVQTPSGSMEGYHVFIGGGVEQERGLGQEFIRNIPYSALPQLLERLFQMYQKCCNGDESFIDFTRRYQIDELRALVGVPHG